MKLGCQILLGLAAFGLTSTLYAAHPCIAGGAPSLRDGTGAGGTGVQADYADGTGQGGTGIAPWKQSDGDGSGTGGTGLTVEVDGVITGFASICVNGLELHYRPGTPISIHGKAGSPADLAVGQVVRAWASGQGDQLAVQKVHVRHLLVAKVQELNASKLLAQGRTISLGPDVVVPSGLAPGIKIAVSGFAGAPGHAVATRLDVVSDDTPDSLTGEVERSAQGMLSVDGIVLEGGLSRLKPGDTVRAEGHYTQGRMQVTRLEREERAQPADRIVIQGLVRHADKASVNIGGQRFLIDTQTRLKQDPPRAGAWAKVDAIREGDQFRAHEVDTKPDPDNHLNQPLRRNSGANNEAETHQFAATSLPDKNADQYHASEQADRPQLMEPPAFPEKIERPEEVEKPEKIERLETVERHEQIERSEKPEKIERPETVERPERIERPEKPEKIERPETVERP